MDSPKDEENLALPDEEPGAPKVFRRMGFMKGQYSVPDDFDTMMADEIEEMFYGTSDKFSDLRDGNKEFQASASALSPKKHLAFALFVFERMLPSLVAFSKDTGFDDSCYLQAKDAAWAALKNGRVARSSIEACLRSAPDTEDYSHELTSYALNAALAMNDIVEFRQDGCTDHISRVSSLAADSVYLSLGSLEDSVTTSPEKAIVCRPLMQEERRWEEEDARFLTSLPYQFS